MQRVLKLFPLLAVAALFSAIGCGPEKPVITEPGEPVSGKVTLKGKPPTGYGSVEFHSVAENRKTVVGVEPSGNFNGIAPLGKVRAVYVVSAPPVMSSSGTTKATVARDPAKVGVELDIPPGGSRDLVIDFTK